MGVCVLNVVINAYGGVSSALGIQKQSVWLQDLYTTARTLASVVVPHEYGLDPQGKLHIGSKICCELLAKLLADLDSMQVGGG
jgi:inositol hexakisphosphate/diphosphoinositol-pentakisphosphate kinase